MVAVIGVCLLWPAPARTQPAFDAQHLANYRLTLPVFTRFARATDLLATRMRQDPRYEQDPLFSKDVAVAGDAVEMATAVRQRLDSDPRLADALFAADISAHEYVTFALALLAARLAHGFVEAGVLRRVPAGVATDNVAFVRDNLADIRRTLTLLGVGARGEAPVRTPRGRDERRTAKTVVTRRVSRNRNPSAGVPTVPGRTAWGR